MSVNLEIHVGLCTPKSVPYTEISRISEVAQRRLVRGPDVRLGDHHPDGALSA